MAINNKAVIVGTPKTLFNAIMSVANTNLDGTTGTYVTVTGTIPAEGTFVRHIIVVAAGNTTAGRIAFFVTRSGVVTGIGTQLVYARTPSATIEPFQVKIPFFDYLGPNDSIKGATYNAETFHVTLTGGDLTAQ